MTAVFYVHKAILCYTSLSHLLQQKVQDENCEILIKYCCIVMPAWTILLFYFNHFYWCILPYVYYCSCNSRPQVAGHRMQQKLLSGVRSGVERGRSLKLAVVEGRTYGAEMNRRTLWLWSDSIPGIVWEAVQDRCSGIRRADGAVKTTRHLYSQGSDAYQTGSPENRILGVPCREDWRTNHVY